MINSRQYKKQQTRQAFFNAILDLGGQGYAFSAISIRQLTHEIGVAPTTFYRHFESMDNLGYCLVNEEINPLLLNLSDRYQIKRNSNYENQIIQRVRQFYAAVDAQPQHWRFLISERYGGSAIIRQAIDQQLKAFMQIMSEDLSLQAPFQQVSAYDRRLVAEVVLNLNLSWVFDWLALSHLTPSAEQDSTKPNSTALQQEKKQKVLENCTFQALMILRGAENWHSEKEIPLDDLR